MRINLRSALIGGVVAALVIGVTTGLAGSGVGGVFNLGQANTVNGMSTLTGASSIQLKVGNTSSGAGTVGILGQSGSASGAGVEGVNLAGGPALQAAVSGDSVAPLKVNSTHLVPNLHAANSDALGGHATAYFLPAIGTAADSNHLGGKDRSYFLPAAATAADSSQLGGYPAATYARSRTIPADNSRFTADSGGVGQYAAATIGADGLPLITYYDATNGHLKVAHCEDAACSSATKNTVDSTTAGTGKYTSITVGTDGLGLISYYDSVLGELRVAHCDNPDCTSATPHTIDDVGNVGEFTSIAIGKDGLGLVSYYDVTNGDLKVAHCADTTCSSASAVTAVDSTGTVGEDTSVTIGSDGLPLISYRSDAPNYELKVVHCTNVTCSSSDAPAVILQAILGETSITTGTDGLGLISFFDGVPSTLGIAHCSDIACSTATALDIDPTSVRGEYNSVSIGADGLGVVAYYDGTNHDLRVAHCVDVNCSTVFASTGIVDGPGDVGQYSSLTIGADGLPFVAYYDLTNTALKVAHCTNAFCVSDFRRR